ncbi:Adhesion G-protein coupled receptor D1 [Trichoplax sp. H2]|nr:Adhesion G-protein coupled receptor D1 [Trichoplax sp. H2]|eukprot:RDD41430.1 Adhesion G-protein coupled receptor D1 [Trichoplax sp. H2]
MKLLLTCCIIIALSSIAAEGITCRNFPRICGGEIAGICIKKPVTQSFGKPPDNMPKSVVQSEACDKFKNYSTISHSEIEGRATYTCNLRPTALYYADPASFNICLCQSIKVLQSVKNLTDTKDAAMPVFIENLRQLLKNSFEFVDTSPETMYNEKINIAQALVGLQIAHNRLNESSEIDETNDLLAGCILDIRQILSSRSSCNDQDESVLQDIETSIKNYLGPRPKLCCQTGEVQSYGECKVTLDPKNCKSNIKNSIIWPALPPGSDVIYDKCNAYFRSPLILGNLSRSCIGSSQGDSQWSGIDTCNCYSSYIADIHERMTREYAINYTLSYLNIMASFLQSHQGDVSSKDLSITTLNLIHQAYLDRKSSSNEDEYKNLTVCLLRSSSNILREVTGKDVVCPIQEEQRAKVSAIMYELSGDLFGQSGTEMLLGPSETFTYESRNISDLIEDKLNGSIFGCVAIGGKVPPGSPNDTILYNIIDYSVIAGGVETESPPVTDDNGNNTNTTVNRNPLEAHKYALAIIGVIGVALSATGIVLTLTSFAMLSLPKTRKWFIHVNLSLAILISNVSFITLADITRDKLVEGIHLYRILVTVFTGEEKIYLLLYMFIGWGTPAVICGMTFAVVPDAYSYNVICWLPVTHIWIFLGPLAAILVVNVIIFGIILYVLRRRIALRMNQGRNRNQAIRTDIRNAVCLLPLLGLCWIVAFFVQIESDVVANYLFTIFVSLQGFELFIFHCVMDKQIIDAFRKRKFRYSQDKLWQDKRENSTSGFYSRNGYASSTFRNTVVTSVQSHISSKAGSTPHSSFYSKTDSKPLSKGIVNPYYATSGKGDEVSAPDSMEFNIIKTNQNNGIESHDAEAYSVSDKSTSIPNETSSDSGTESTNQLH